MHKIITEERAKIKVPVVKKISKEMDVFYNPVMKLNRDISVLLLNSVEDSGLRIGLPLAASGVRGVRFLLELGKGKIKEIYFNDHNNNFKKILKENFKLNRIDYKTKYNKKINISNEDANLFLLNSTGFDYLDIDPFGTPNPFLDSAVKRIARCGILAVTATDTAALCGAYADACLRKYWAVPLRNELMHETGLRILIRKVQLIGAQYEKALVPIFSYSKEHYMRVFFRCSKGKKKVDEVVKQHGHFDNAGPMWLGGLWDYKLGNRMFLNYKKSDVSNIEKDELYKFLRIIKDESKTDIVGFYDIHALIKRGKIKFIPRKMELINAIKRKGHEAAETHFNPNGVRSDISKDNLLKLIKDFK